MSSSANEECDFSVQDSDFFGDDDSTCDLIITKLVQCTVNDERKKVAHDIKIEKEEDFDIVYEKIKELQFIPTVLKSSNTVVKEEKDLEILYENIKDGQSNSTGIKNLNTASETESHNVDYLSLSAQVNKQEKQMVDQSTTANKSYIYRHKKPTSRSHPYSHFKSNQKYRKFDSTIYHSHYKYQPFHNKYNNYKNNMHRFKNHFGYSNGLNYMGNMMQDYHFKMMLFREYYFFSKFLDFYQYNMGF